MDGISEPPIRRLVAFRELCCLEGYFAPGLRRDPRNHKVPVFSRDTPNWRRLWGWFDGGRRAPRARRGTST